MTMNIEQRTHAAVEKIEVSADKIKTYSTDLENRGEAALASIGGKFIGEYAANIQFTDRYDYVIQANQAYKVKLSTALPFATTGNFINDQQFLEVYDNAAEAKQAEVNAKQSEINAENSANAAAASAKIYKTVAEGIAATTNGQLFLVVSDDRHGFSDLYLNDGGAGVYQDKTTVDITFAESFVCEEYIGLDGFSISDDKGNTVLSADEVGNITVNSITEVAPLPQSTIIEHIGIEDFSVIDEQGNASQKQTGSDFEPGIGSNKKLAEVTATAVPQADIIVALNMGQSNAGSHPTFAPPVTTTLKFNNLIWRNGRPEQLALTPTEHELPTIACVDMITQLTLSNADIELADYKTRYLVVPFYEGGTSITYWTARIHLLSLLLTKVKSWCDANSKTVNLGFFTWTQGEADEGGAYTDDYAAEMDKLFDGVQGIAKDVFQQTNTVKCLTWTLSQDTGLADAGLIKASNKNADILICGHKYSALYFGDQVHFNALGSAVFGSQYGKFFYESMYLKSNPEALRMVDVVRRSNTIIDVHINKRGCIIDNVTHPAAQGQGFYVKLDKTQRERIYASTVETINKKIKLTFTQDISQAQAYYYGVEHAADIVGNLPAGNIRDQSGEVFKTEISGNIHKIHNWLLPFTVNAED